MYISFSEIGLCCAKADAEEKEYNIYEFRQSFLLLRCCYISYRYFKGWLNGKKAFIRFFCFDLKIHFIPLTSEPQLQLCLGIIFKASNISFGFPKNTNVQNRRHAHKHTHSHTHTHPLSQTYTHTLTQTLAHKHAHSRNHADTLKERESQ